MKLYFSGFSLQNEKELFDEYREESDFVVSGFSFGAIKAFEYVLNSDKRIDKLQLFSPSYFQDKDKKYKRMQLMYFKKNASLYCDNFLQNCGFTKQDSNKYFALGSYEELDLLLHYDWNEELFKQIINRKIKIEVYLGSEDKIISSHEALSFFKKYAEVYYIKNKGHIL